jgi:hypothetical protein
MADHDRDDRLLRRLYQESDAGADEADADLAREVASLERLRGVFHDYARATEVEPPTRGLDELMAAARARAKSTPAVAAKVDAPSLWQRIRSWFALIVAHPALASVAVLVLVGGVAGTMYLRGRVGPTEAVAPAETVDDIAIARPNAAPPSDEVAKAPTATLDDEFTVKGGQAAGSGSAVAVAPGRERARVTKRGAGGGGGGARQTATGDGASAGADKLALEVEDRAGTKGRVDDQPDGVAVGEGVIEESPPVVVAPPPPPPGPPAQNAPRVPEAGGAGGSGDRPDVSRLTQQARQYAKDRKCVDVKKIGERVRAVDASYYRATFATDPDIKTCL